MPNTGNVFPGTGSTVDRAGATAWTNPGNIVSNNASDTTAAVPTDYLLASNFDFSAIPDDAVIVGVTVRVEAGETGTGSSNYVPQLISDTTPTLIGSAKSAVTVNGSTKVVSTNGGTTDLWGATLTPAIVKSSGFGVAIWSTDTTNTLAIDYVTIAIEYALRTSKTLSESVSLYDSNVQLVQGRRAGDTITAVSDAQYLGRTRGRVMQDTVTLVDELIKVIESSGVIYSITLSDGTIISDGITLFRLRDRRFAESLAIVDFQYLGRERGRVMTDSVALIDELIAVIAGGGVVFTITLSDSTTITDQLVLMRLRDRKFAEALGIIDFQYYSLTRGKSFADAVAVYDANTQFTHGRRIGDVITVSQAIGLARYRLRVVSDQIDLADAIVTVAGGGDSQTYTITLSDGTVIVDSLVLGVFRNRGLFESVVVDDAGVMRILEMISSEGVSLADTAYLSRLRGRTSSEALVITDQLLAHKALFRVLSDAVTLIDNFIASVFGGVLFQITLSDVIAVTDGILTSRHRNRTLVDPLTLIDEKLAYRLLHRLPTDTATITDQLLSSILGGTTLVITLSDAVAVADAFNLARYRNRGLVDPVAAIDELILQRQRNRGPFTDNISLSDGTVVTRERVKYLSEVLTVTDTQLRFLLRMMQAGDNVTVSDGILTFRLLSRELSDAFSVIDSRVAQLIGEVVPLVLEVRIRLGEAAPVVVLSHQQEIMLSHDATFIKLGG